MPSSVRAAAIAAVDDCNKYPDPYCRALRGELSRVFELPEDWFFCGSGAADVIFRLSQAICPQSALVTAPTFSEYESSLAPRGCEVRRFALWESEGFRVSDRILDAISGAEIVFICNPNNPTGATVPRELLLDIARKCRDLGAIFVIDECFNDFLAFPDDFSFLPHLREFPNVVVLRSFTKMFAMAGVRLGFCVSSDVGLIARLYDAGPPWNVSEIAQRCGLAALGETDFARRSREYIAAERRRLTGALRELGIIAFDSAANYVMIRSERDLKSELASRGILIRSCADYAGLGGEYYRVAVRLAEENDVLIGALRDVLRDITNI
jgi:threonine-phosphate decarboxylase